VAQAPSLAARGRIRIVAALGRVRGALCSAAGARPLPGLTLRARTLAVAAMPTGRRVAAGGAARCSTRGRWHVHVCTIAQPISAFGDDSIAG